MCGKEAYNYEDLDNFSTDKNNPYGKQNICKCCKDRLKYFKNNPNNTEDDYQKILERRDAIVKFKVSLAQDKILIKCKKCGKVASTQEELSFFVKNNKSKLGVIAKCKECDAEDTMLRNYPTINLLDYKSRKEDKIKYLKKCRYCGKTANTEEELTMFVTQKDTTLGKSNVCVDCFKANNKEYRNRPDVKIRLKNNRDRYFKSEKGRKLVRKSNRERKLKLRTRSFNEDISLIYEIVSALNKLGGIKYEVDHIYPLNHPAMCGLHTKNNLQILEDDINNDKNNKLGYLYQFNCTPLARDISRKATKQEVYSLLGCSLSYEEYLEYEKLNFKEYLD